MSAPVRPERRAGPPAVAERAQTAAASLRRPPERLLDLQRVAGNRATARALARLRRGNHAGGRVLARLRDDVAETGETLHVRWGDARLNLEDLTGFEGRPILIEVMETNEASAIAKIEQIAALQAGNHPPRLAISVFFNQKAAPSDFSGDEGRLKSAINLRRAYGKLYDARDRIAKALEDNKVMGGCFPGVWSPTDTRETAGGYVFPFLEMRSRVTLHPGTQRLVKALRAYGDPIVRSMDADVRDDPLLTGAMSAPATKALEDLDVTQVFSGGYSWDTRDQPKEYWHGERNKEKLARWNGKLKAALALINAAEHGWRTKLAQTGDAVLLYWPEPNTYMTANRRLQGAKDVAEMLEKGAAREVQQRESIFYLRGAAQSHQGLKGTYESSVATTKPLKSYFDGLRDMIIAADKAPPSPAEVKAYLLSIRQSHFAKEHVGDIQKWYGVSVRPRLVEQADQARDLKVTKLADDVQKVLAANA